MNALNAISSKLSFGIKSKQHIFDKKQIIYLVSQLNGKRLLSVTLKNIQIFIYKRVEKKIILCVFGSLFEYILNHYSPTLLAKKGPGTDMLRI